VSGNRDRNDGSAPGYGGQEQQPRPALSPGKVTQTQRLVTPSRGRRSLAPGKRTMTSQLARPGALTAGQAQTGEGLQVSAQHVRAKLDSGVLGAASAQSVSIEITAPAVDLLPLSCRMRLSPGGPPVVVDPGPLTLQPGQSHEIDLRLSGASGRSDLTFVATGADGVTLASPSSLSRWKPRPRRAIA